MKQILHCGSRNMTCFGSSERVSHSPSSRAKTFPHCQRKSNCVCVCVWNSLLYLLPQGVKLHGLQTTKDGQPSSSCTCLCGRSSNGSIWLANHGWPITSHRADPGPQGWDGREVNMYAKRVHAVRGKYSRYIMFDHAILMHQQHTPHSGAASYGDIEVSRCKVLYTLGSIRYLHCR